MSEKDDDDEIPQDVLDSWPNCATPDCHHKRCLWSGTVYCHPCATQLLGPEELERRYEHTHPEAGR